MNQKHKWCEEIKAWADGKTVQYRRHEDAPWITVTASPPLWSEVGYYQVKPKIELVDAEWYLVENINIANSTSVRYYHEHTKRFIDHNGNWSDKENMRVLGTVSIKLC